MTVRELIQTFGIVLLAVLVHLIIALTPGLPELEPNSETRMFVRSMWAVEAALVGAILVALFFAFSSVQRFAPTRIAIVELVRELRLAPVIGVLVATLLGTGLTVLMLLPAPWDWPLAARSLWTLPILDLFILTVALMLMPLMVLQVLKFIHPSALRQLTSQVVNRLARKVSEDEVREAASRKAYTPLLLTAEEVAKRAKAAESQADLADLPEAREEEARGLLRELLEESHDQTIRALASDDAEKLLEHLDLLDSALQAYTEVTLPPPNLRHTIGTERVDKSLLDHLGYRLCPERVRYDSQRLMSESVFHSAIKSIRSLIWYPFHVWQSGLRQDNHEVAAMGLEIAGTLFAQLVRSTDVRSESGTWIRYWRESYLGPENYLTMVLRPQVKRGGDLEEVRHVIQAALEVQNGLFLAAGLSVGLETPADACGHLLASHATMHNIFWPIDDPGYEFADDAKNVRATYKKFLARSMVFLLGMLAVRYLRDGQNENVIATHLHICRDRYDWEALNEAVRADLERGLPWFNDYISISDEPPIYSDALYDYAYNEDLQACALLLLLPQFFDEPKKLGTRQLQVYFDNRPRFKEVVARISQNPQRWRTWVSKGWLSAYQGVAR